VKTRRIIQIIEGVKTTDGAGVHLTRLIGAPDLKMLDPFLLFDEFGTDNPDDYIAGFPSHPHRGFETITYMLKGKWEHSDSKGNRGILTDGSVQWMTAGRGIIHSEMPIQTDGLARGFQLWLNLPKEKKMIAPAYQDIHRDQIPTVMKERVRARVISGQYEGITGPGKSHTPVLILDIHLKPKTKTFVHIPSGWNTFVYIYKGAVSLSEILSKGQLAVFTQVGEMVIQTEDLESKVYLVAGEPLNEPVSRGGPFVMNTSGEIIQAFADYESGKIDL
tara:strand:- start:4346 stop:5173 length:828 start_codon:yes stop_codon:yes gene_type:complete